MAKMLKKKNINFYAAFYRKAPLEKSTLKKRLLIGVPLTIGFVLLLACAVIYGQILYQNYKISEIADYLNQDDVASVYQEAAAIASDREAFENEVDYFTAVSEDLDSYPVFSSEDLTRIYGAVSGGSSIQGVSYNVESGVLTISAEAPKYDYAAQTAAALRGLGLFSDVQYVGYESGTSGVYYFEAYCVVKGGEEE